MDFILENLTIGNYLEALVEPQGIDALLCVAKEKDIPVTSMTKYLYHKVPIVDMQPIPAGLLTDSP
jgi:hypothetical protein